jgi:hypothetical protein
LRQLAWDWLLDSEVQLVDFGLDDLPRMRARRKRHADREVDFSDKTLVWLGDQRRTNLIATTDFDDFEAYRLPNGKPFKYSSIAPESFAKRLRLRS